MANNIIAFVGKESFDIILYLSRLLLKLEHKVLIVDYTETKALTHSIPQIPGVDTELVCITYRQVDFTAKVIDEKIAEQYDDILIDCGLRCPEFDLLLLTRIVYVTDMFEFNMKRIGRINFYDGLSVGVALLIRDVMNTKITTEYIVSKINKNIPPEMISVLYRDDADYENSLLCHYNQIFSLLHVSWTMKTYLMEEVRVMYPEVTNKQIKTAYSKARKGE